MKRKTCHLPPQFDITIQHSLPLTPRNPLCFLGSFLYNSTKGLECRIASEAPNHASTPLPRIESLPVWQAGLPEAPAMTFWEFFALAMATAVMFTIVLALSTWATNRIMDWKEHKRNRQ